jgi:hypothetical protein
MHTVSNEHLSLSIDEQGNIASLRNTRVGVEVIQAPGPFFRLIFRDGKIEENCIEGGGHDFEVTSEGATIKVSARGLRFKGRTLPVAVTCTFELRDDEVLAWAKVANDADVEIMEWVFPMVRGVRSISKDPARDALIVPSDLGMRFENPRDLDYNAVMGSRIYEGPEHLHTNFYKVYPGDACMQWFELDGDRCGLYMASYDSSQQSTTLAFEKKTADRTLAFSFIKYPFLEKGESFQTSPYCVSLHGGDWHAGARKYRKWIESEGWKAPVRPQWMSEFTGWLRVIMKNQFGEINFSYGDMERLYRQTREAGMNTLFILGWIPGGFSRLWPEYEADDDLGGQAELQEQIRRIHGSGGKVLFFTSYYIIDPDTEFYRSTGKRLAVKNVWGREVTFSETYFRHGTWRKIMNGNKPMVVMCPSTPEWQETLLQATDRIMSYGADGVLYDIGGHRPSFCYDTTHPHERPSLAFATKSQNFRGLRENIKRHSPEAMVAMEHNVDIYGQHMDLAHSGGASRIGKHSYPELYRYTFPEIMVTNRESGQDERDHRDHVHFGLLYGLRYDMTIFRCQGELDDIPSYKAYLAKVNAMRLAHKDLLLNGRFVDNEGFSLDNPALCAKAYRAGGRLGIVVWNPTDLEQRFAVRTEGRFLQAVAPEGERATLPKVIAADSVMLLVWADKG